MIAAALVILAFGCVLGFALMRTASMASRAEERALLDGGDDGENG